MDLTGGSNHMELLWFLHGGRLIEILTLSLEFYFVSVWYSKNVSIAIIKRDRET